MHARRLQVDEHQSSWSDAVAVSRSRARYRLLERRVFSLHGPFEGRADVSTRSLLCALSAILVPGEMVRGDSGRTGDRRNGPAWNLRFRAEGACEYTGSAHTAAARRSGVGDHARAERDTNAHRAATEADVNARVSLFHVSQ